MIRPRQDLVLKPNRLLILALGIAALLVASPAPAAPPSSDAPDIFVQMADEVTAKVMTSPIFQAKTDGGRRARIVIGDVMNNSDDEGVRVDDLLSEIRNQIVSSGTTRLFAPGELNVDFIIAPELTSAVSRDAQGGRRHCFKLNLTLSKPSGEFVVSQTSTRCD